MCITVYYVISWDMLLEHEDIFRTFLLILLFFIILFFFLKPILCKMTFFISGLFFPNTYVSFSNQGFSCIMLIFHNMYQFFFFFLLLLLLLLSKISMYLSFSNQEFSCIMADGGLRLGFTYIETLI
jgi:hypothetical protein